MKKSFRESLTTHLKRCPCGLNSPYRHTAACQDTDTALRPICFITATVQHFSLTKHLKKLDNISIEKGRRQPPLDDQKTKIGYVYIGDGYFYSNTPASIHQALINSNKEI